MMGNDLNIYLAYECFLFWKGHETKNNIYSGRAQKPNALISIIINVIVRLTELQTKCLNMTKKIR